MTRSKIISKSSSASLVLKASVLTSFLITVLALILSAPTATAQESSNYTVKPGDTLFSISQAHNVSVGDLRSWNDLENTVLRAGLILRIAPPVAAPESIVDPSEEVPGDGVSEDEVDSSAEATPPQIGSVTFLEGDKVSVVLGAGETLYSLALQFSIHPDSLLALNPHLGDSLAEGDVVILPSDRASSSYVVKRGDTLFAIARSTGVGVAIIREENSLSGSNIRVGQRLKIPALNVAGDGTELQYEEELHAVVYPNLLVGRMLSGGSRYDPASFLVGHPNLPMGTILLLEGMDGSHETFAIVSDRSISRSPEILEVSEAVAEALQLKSAGELVKISLVH